MDGWYYMRGEDQVGPVTEATMMHLAGLGEFQPATMVLHPSKTGNRWTGLDSVPLLHSLTVSHSPQPDHVTETVYVAEALSEPSLFRCPYCSSNTPPLSRYEISTGGWIVCLVLVFVCFPVFWLGMFITEHHIYCRQCGMRLN